MILDSNGFENAVAQPGSPLELPEKVIGGRLMIMSSRPVQERQAEVIETDHRSSVTPSIALL